MRRNMALSTRFPFGRRWSVLVLAAVLSALVFVAPASAQTTEFRTWLDGLRAEALAKGISRRTLDAALRDVAPLKRVIKADRKQPEFTQAFWHYLDARISDQRIERGRKMLRTHKALLEEIYRKYGVQPRFIVAFWALETNFGDYTGKIPLVSALATLAFDGRRGRYFRKQLLAALDLMDKGDIPIDAQGSWAGALGQPQFMPTNYQAYAVDYDGDGRRDLWRSLPDVFASAANFLSRLGWDGSKTWGREVRLPTGFDLGPVGMRYSKRLREWQELGVRTATGEKLPRVDIAGSLILPAGYRGPAFLVYNNFRKTMRWNASTYYAIAVGYLADRLAGRAPLRTPRPKSEDRLLRQQVVEIQELLAAQGYEVGEPDGIVGPMTREAIKAYQRAASVPPDGYPTTELLASLQKTVSRQ